MKDDQYQPVIFWRKCIKVAFLFWTLISLATVLLYAGGRVLMYPAVLKISLLWNFNYTAAGILLYWLTHKILLEKYSRLVFFLIHLFIGLTLSAIVTALAFVDLYIFPFRSMQNYLDEMYLQYFHISLIAYAGAVFFFYFLQYLRRSREQAVREAHLKQLSQEAELRALKAQINPHFLFNALNSINSLVVKEPLKAREMIVSLATTLRYVLETSESGLVSVKEEIEFVKTYLAIEKIRFGEKLHIEYDVAKNLEKELLPPVILQPLVENAVKHGITKKTGGGSVKVEVLAHDGDLVCRVSDTGAGLPHAPGEAPKKTLAPDTGEPDFSNVGLGLKNIRERLQAIYGQDFSLTLKNNRPHGCIAEITLPLEQEGAE